MKDRSQPLLKEYVAPALLSYNVNDRIEAPDNNNPLVDNYGALEQAKAAYFQLGGSSWLGFKNIIADQLEPIQSGFNAYDDVKVKSLSSEDQQRFSKNIMRARNQDHLNSILDEIDSIKKLDAVWNTESGVVNTAAATFGGIAGMITDPTNIIVGAGAFTRVAKGLELALGVGARTASTVGLAGLGATSAVARQGLAEGTAGRSHDEFLLDLTLSTVVSGAIGNLIGKSTRSLAEAEQILKDMDAGKNPTATETVSNVKHDFTTAPNPSISNLEVQMGSVPHKMDLNTYNKLQRELYAQQKAEFPNEPMKWTAAVISPNDWKSSSELYKNHLFKKLANSKYGLSAKPMVATAGVQSNLKIIENIRSSIPDVVKTEDRLGETVDFKLIDKDNLDLQIKKPEGIMGAIFGGALKVASWVEPIYNLGTSQSKMARTLGHHLVGYEVSTNAAEKGLQSIPVEKMVQSGIHTKVHQHLMFYDTALEKVAKRGISQKEFDAEIKDVIFNNKPSKIAEVNEYVANRQKMLDDMGDEAEKLGLFGKDADGIPLARVKKKGNYVAVVHDYDKIARYPTRAFQVYGDALLKNAKNQLADLEAQVKQGKVLDEKLQSDYNELKKLIAEHNTNPTKSPFKDMGKKFVDDHTGERANIVRSTVFSSSQFKKISLNVDHADIREFIVDRHPIDMFNMYVHDHVNAVEFTARFGDANMDEVFDMFNKEYAELISKAEAEGKDTSKLVAEQAKMGENIRGIKFRIQGKRTDGTRGYGAADLIVDAITTLTSQKLMWAGAISQIPDLATLTVEMANGTMGKLSTEFVAQHGALLKALDPEVAQMIGLVSENLDTRALAMFESGTEGKQFSEMAKVMSKGREWVYKLNFMQAVNNVSKAWAGEVTTKKIIDSAYKLAAYAKKYDVTGDLPDDVTKLLDKELAGHVLEFRKYGMDLSDARRIIDEFDKHAITIDGVKMANMTKWEHKIRGKVFGAVKSIVDNHYIIEPNSGNKHFWFDSLVGRLIFQFKGFWAKSFAAYLLKDLQAANSEAVAKFAFRSILGTLAYLARGAARAPLDQIDTDPKKLVYEGITRGGSLSGLDGIAGLLDTIGAMTNTPVGPAYWMGLRKERRYGQDNQISDLMLGASGVFIKDADAILKSVGTGKFQETLAKKGIPYLPILNTFYAKPILDFAIGKRDRI